MFGACSPLIFLYHRLLLTLFCCRAAEMQSHVKDLPDFDASTVPTMLDPNDGANLCNEGTELLNVYPSVLDAQGGKSPVHPQGALLFNPTASIAREKWVFIKFQDLVEGPLPVQVFSKEENKREFRRSPAKIFLKNKPNRGHDVYFHSRFVWGMSDHMLDRNKARIKKIYNSNRRKSPTDVSAYFLCVDAFNEVQFPFLDYRPYELNVLRFDHQNYSAGRKLVIDLIYANKVPGIQVLEAVEYDDNENLLQPEVYKKGKSRAGQGDSWENEELLNLNEPGSSPTQHSGGSSTGKEGGAAGGAGGGGAAGGAGGGGAAGGAGGGGAAGGSGSGAGGAGGGAAGGAGGGGQPPRRGGGASEPASPEPQWRKDQKARKLAALRRSKGGTPALQAQEQQQQQQQQQPDFVENLTENQRKAYNDRMQQLQDAEKRKADLAQQMQLLQQQQALLMQEQQQAAQAALQHQQMARLVETAHLAPNPIQPGLIGGRKRKSPSPTPAATANPAPNPAASTPVVTTSVTASGSPASTAIQTPTTYTPQVTQSSPPPPTPTTPTASSTGSTTTGGWITTAPPATPATSSPAQGSASVTSSGSSLGTTAVSSTSAAHGSISAIPSTAALASPSPPSPVVTSAPQMPPPTPPPAAKRQSSRLAAAAAATAMGASAGTTGTTAGPPPTAGTSSGPPPSAGTSSGAAGTGVKRTGPKRKIVGPSPKKRRQGYSDNELDALREHDERTIQETRDLLEQSDVGKLLYSLMESWFRSLSREVKENSRILRELVDKHNQDDDEVCQKKRLKHV